MTMYRIVIDGSLCSGFGTCADLAPDHFEVGRGRDRHGPRGRDATTRSPRGRRAVPDGRDRDLRPRDRGAGGMTPRSVVIVGAGLAGAAAPRRSAPQGYDGRVVLVGEEPVAPYERPALSKEFLAGERDRRRAPRRRSSGPSAASSSCSAAASTRSTSTAAPPGRGSSGTRSSSRPVPGPAGCRSPVPAGVHTLRTLADAEALGAELRPGARLAVIGAGFVGTEVASTARSLGVEVTLVDIAAVPLERVLGRRSAGSSPSASRQHGVDLRLGTGLGRSLPTAVASAGSS